MYYMLSFSFHCQQFHLEFYVLLLFSYYYEKNNVIIVYCHFISRKDLRLIIRGQHC